MVSTLIAYVATTFSISVAAATFAVNFAVSLIVTRIFAENPEQQQDMGVRQQVPPSAVNAIPVVYGTAYMGGTFVDAVLTEDQKTMYYVLAISSISPNGQFTFDTADMYFGDRKITFGTGSDSTKVVSLTDEAGNVNTKISGNLYINLYTSTAGGTITSANGASAPSTVMGGSDIAVGQRWTGTRQMNGLGFAIVKLIYNRDADTTQLSPITFKVSHTLNGTGVAKAGDVWYDYMTNAVYGGAVDAAFVNSTSATALNTYGDQTITFTNSSGNPATQARYRINGVLDAGQSVLSNVDRIMSACDSWMTYNAALGQWSVVVNKAESTAYAFTDNNIIGEIRVSATDITSSINQVEARFPFKDNRDQAAFVNIETPSGLLYPNEPVNKYSITYDLVNDSVQASYLANRLLEQAREDLIVGFSTTYYGIQVDAGDVVSVTNSDYGWNAKLFRVMKVNEASLPDGSLGAKLELSEYNAQVYDDATIQQFTPVPNSGLPSVSYFSPLAAPTVTGFATATIPYINVQVFIPTTGRVTFGNLFWTTSATPTSADWKLVTSASTTDGQPVTNGTYYTFANITLNTGTYYFAYMVGNDVTSSVLSPISAALVWNPVAGAGPTGPTGATGTTGGSGDSVDIIFKRSATQPATPSPSVGTPATWYSDVNSVPAGTDPIWSSVGTNTGTGTNYTWQTPLLIEGQNGTDGLSVAELLIYIRATSAPSTPTGGSYNFTTQTLTAPTSWFSYVPSGTDPVYTSRSVASIQGTTGTDSSLTWTTPTLSFQNGATGATGPTGASVTGPSGLVGLSSLTAYKVQAQSDPTPTFTTPTTGATAPSGWSLTTPAVAVGQVLWYIQGRYNANAVTVDGVPAGQTAWTGPVAASIFQDIRSDNWNGGTPTTNAPTGSVGYYIKQSNGNMYLNSVYARGVAQFDGANLTSLGNSAILGNNTLSQPIGVTGFTQPTVVGYGIYGYNSTSASNVGSGVHGVADGASASGVRGLSNNVGGYGVRATNNSAGVGFDISNGTMTTANNTLVTNLNADLLDGNHATAFATVASGTDAYAANRLNGSAGANVLRFVQGTVTGTGVATFNASNKPASNSTNVWMQITIDGTTLYIPVWT